MTWLELIYPALKPWLFRLDAETAHSLTVKMMVISHKLGLLRSVGASDAPVSCMGLTFRNRLGLAAGMDKSASAVDAWAALGLGHVEVGTLTPRPQPGNAKPRLFRLPEHKALINRMGFNNPGIISAVKLLENRRSEAIVGVNIGKNFDTPNESAVNDYAFCLKAAYRTADYITVNISSPNTKGLRDLQAEDAVRHLLSTLKEEQASLQIEHGKTVPLLVKIAPDLNEMQIESLALVINEINLDGVIATNTTIDREVVAGHPLANEVGGLSGAPVRDKSTLILQAFRRLLKPSIPLVGVGGILEGRDAVDKIQHGAELVQIYSGLVFRGPALIRESLAALSMK